MKVTSHRTFLKAYSRLSTLQKKQIDAALLLFQSNRADPSLHDHALKGKMKSLRTFSAGHDLRVIYREQGGFITIVLLDAGTHNQAY
jgi:addiction module RelE/StbE family toxin